MDMALAQATSQAVATTGGFTAADGMNSMISVFFRVFVPIAVLYYILIMSPQKKERKKKEDLLNSIQRGDRILTRGGMYGTVSDIKENVLVLKISENTKIEVDRSYVENVQKNI